MVFEDKPFPVIKLCDFGLGRVNNLEMNSIVGTIVTQDPEMIYEREYTDRIDLYAIGCMLFKLIYKQYPCEEYWRDRDRFWNLIKNKEYIFRKFKTSKKNECIDCCKKLLRYNDDEMDWEIFRELSYVKKCIDKIDKYKQKLTLLQSYEVQEELYEE